jgi:hypothetical protein
VPERAELPDRLDTVLHVIYLVFNEGYFASSGASLTRHDLSGEAIRLGRLLVELLPEPEAEGLLALMLLSLIMSAALPTAFGSGGLVVAGAYVTMQLGRTVFAIAAPLLVGEDLRSAVATMQDRVQAVDMLGHSAACQGTGGSALAAVAGVHIEQTGKPPAPSAMSVIVVKSVRLLYGRILKGPRWVVSEDRVGD